MNRVCNFKFVLFLSLTIAIQADSFGQSAGDATHKTAFSKLTGNVLDSNGRPIQNFKVSITLQNPLGDALTQEIKKWEGDFQNGRFQFDVGPPVEFGGRGWMLLKIFSAGYITGTPVYKAANKLASFDGDFGRIRLARGVGIKGRFVINGNSQKKLVYPVASISKVMKTWTSDSRDMFHAKIQVEEDGSFSAAVPEASTFELLAYSHNAAAVLKRFDVNTIQDGVQEMGAIELEEGVAAEGTVLRIDGAPAAGQRVRISHSFAAENGHRSLVVDGYATTDKEGRFKLPPRLGQCTIALAEQSHDGKSVQPALPAKPLKITLEKGGHAGPLMIREVAAWRVSGAIVGADGGLPSNCAIWIRTGQRSFQTDIDSQGQFEFPVPEGVEAKLAFSFYGVGGSRKFVSLTSEALDAYRQYLEKPRAHSRQFTFKGIESDIGPLHFEISKKLE